MRRTLAVAVLAALALVVPTAAQAAAYPSDSQKPDLIPLLSGYDGFWASDGKNDLHGTVVNADVLRRDDQLTVWINQHATAAQRFRALQDSEYQTPDGTAYDQSITVSTGMGSVLGPLYVQGRNSGALPLTTALVNSSTGSTGAYVSTGDAKAHFSHPRPYLPSDPSTPPVAGDQAACAPAVTNGSSQRGIRVGAPWADARGNLLVTRVAPATDTTRAFSPNAVTLDPGYGTEGLCRGGSFPSGHTTTAYEAGITLATLLPELAPELLARASEAGNNRIVLGVHYPLDIMGGRIDGEAALAARWSDPQFRTQVLEPARAELVAYLQRTCGNTLAWCIAHQTAYSSDPYGGQRMPGGSSQRVSDRRSAVAVYRERMTYGFAPTDARGQAPSVPDGAASLLRSAFPTLTDAQRTAVLAQTEISSGYPLDGAGSWERLDLAAATSATVIVLPGGTARVLTTGGPARVISIPGHGGWPPHGR